MHPTDHPSFNSTEPVIFQGWIIVIMLKWALTPCFVWSKSLVSSQVFLEIYNNTLHVYESESEVAQSCPTLCNPVDCILLHSSIHGIFQARVLEWVAISFSRGSNPGLSHCRQTLYLSHQGRPTSLGSSVFEETLYSFYIVAIPN